MQCWNCGHVRGNKGWQFCRKCLSNLYQPQVKVEKRRRPLTEHEALKLTWHRNESKWIENIRSRKTVEKNGQRFVVSNQGIMPRQPEKYYQNGGRTK